MQQFYDNFLGTQKHTNFYQDNFLLLDLECERNKNFAEKEWNL